MKSRDHFRILSPIACYSDTGSKSQSQSIICTAICRCHVIIFVFYRVVLRGELPLVNTWYQVPNIIHHVVLLISTSSMAHERILDSVLWYTPVWNILYVAYSYLTYVDVEVSGKTEMQLITSQQSTFYP